jgi:hypothetical protein
MKVLPPLLTGNSPPNQAPKARNQSSPAKPPRFQGMLSSQSMSTFISDTGGVLIPSVPMSATRGGTNVFETIYLEIVEDAAYYFTLPVVGPLLAKGLAHTINHSVKWKENEAAQKLTKTLELKHTRDLMGVPIRDLIKTAESKFGSESEKVLKPIIATKMSALFGVFAVAAGLEFMIQHTKNVITAKQFKIKNFAAVAGLESRKNEAQAGNMDPVEKAKKRGKFVGSLVLGSLALALAGPSLIKNSNTATKLATKFLHYVDFGKGFDLSKPVFAGLITTGVASYMDASRDSLERKEIATRLAVVVPFLLFGKEMAGYGLAKSLEQIKISVGNNLKKPIKDLVPFTSGKTPWHQMSQKVTLLDMNVVKNRAAIDEELKALSQKANSEITPSVQKAVTKAHWALRAGSYVVSAMVCGIGINWIAFRQTQQRYKRQQEALQNQTLQQQRQAATPFALPNAAFAGRQPLTFQPNAFARPLNQPSPFAFPVPQRVAVQ